MAMATRVTPPAGGAGRSQPHAANAVAVASATPRIAVVGIDRVVRLRAAPLVRGSNCSVVDTSAEENSAASANRSAGSLASAVVTARSTAIGTVSRTWRSATGDVVSTRATIACAVGPVNGGSPANISYVTTPSA
jgi:hypothetical protein